MVEQKRSRGGKAALVEELGRTVMRWQDATQKYDEAVGEIYGLGPAERLCLSLLAQGPQMASAIAREIRLTPAAVTSLIDRLEKRGFVRRKPDPADRRKVWVEAAAATQQLIAETYLPLSEAGAANLARYTLDELRIVESVLAESMALQEQMTAELLAKHGK